jgi:hypothetical protein
MDLKDCLAMVGNCKVRSKNDLASYTDGDWAATFKFWQQAYVKDDGPVKHYIVLPPPTQRLIKCASWICTYAKRIGWTALDLRTLTREQVESARFQVERERADKLDPNKIDELVLPKLNDKEVGGSMVRLCRKFREVAERYRGTDGTPLAYCIRERLAGKPWSEDCPGGTIKDWAEADVRSIERKTIVPAQVNKSCWDVAATERAYEEGGSLQTRRTPEFKEDSDRLHRLGVAFFKDTLAVGLWKTPPRGKLGNARQAYRATLGQFLGEDFTRREAEKMKRSLIDMRYEGEKPNYSWSKHLARFNTLVQNINDAAAEGHCQRLQDSEINSLFLDTIKDDCDNADLKVTKVFITSNRADFPTLMGDIIPKLTQHIPERGAGSGDSRKPRRIATTGTTPGGGGPSRVHGRDGQGYGSRNRGGKKARVPKAELKNGKVVGQLEGIRYEPPFWNALTPDQKAEVARLRKQAAAGRKAAAASSAAAEEKALDDRIKRQVAQLASEGQWNRDGPSSRSRDTAGDEERSYQSGGRHSRDRSRSRDREDAHSGRRHGGRRPSSR